MPSQWYCAPGPLLHNINSLLVQTVHCSHSRAKADMDSHVAVLESWEEFCTSLDKKKLIMAPFCGQTDCEDAVKKQSTR